MSDNWYRVAPALDIPLKCMRAFSVGGRDVVVCNTPEGLFALGNTLSLILFVADGKVTGDGLTAAAVAFPAWSVGMLVGRSLQPRVPERYIRSIVLGLLLTTGVATIVAAV